MRQAANAPLPAGDPEYLASLESPGIPSVHNMILGDRIVSKLPYSDSIRYATFLATRLSNVFSTLRPTAVVASFDALHSSMSFAVARHMGIPWFALHFSVIPAGMACFCNALSPASRVQLHEVASEELQARAAQCLENFRSRKIQAPAHIAPPPPTVLARIRELPSRFRAAVATMYRTRSSESLKFTVGRGRLSVLAATGQMRRAHRARRALGQVPTLDNPPEYRYVLFGLHMQPESSIDVWAPFFSNQSWVIELLSRSVPPTHRLLVKIHKSDVSKYTRAELRRMLAFPGVELVRPFVDTRKFIERADLIVAIQGTMALEGALLGKPVIMLGRSPVTTFPGVRQVGDIEGLPDLVRSCLRSPVSSESEILQGYANYLRPFMPASHNNWATEKTNAEIDNFAALFNELGAALSTGRQL